MADRGAITPQLLSWWDAGHADLPWRESEDPYAIWIAEVMLQQTQIATVIPYYKRWLARFPTVEALAAADLDDVLKLWEGLGYYSRARNLHAAARQIVEQYSGKLPETAPELMNLPGIGRYTAGAIASIAFNQREPVLDGNVIRVLTRLYDVDRDITQTAVRHELWELAGGLVPADRPGDFNEALMELGQQICLPAQPRCLICPLTNLCLARQRGTQYERPVRPPRKRIPHYDVVAAVIWEKQGQIGTGRLLIAQRPLDGMLGGLWEFPGGKVEEGESHAEALQRELREEMAIEVIPGDFLAQINHAYTHFRITLYAYHTVYSGGRPSNLGVANHAWVTLDDLENYAFAVTDRRIIMALEEAYGRPVRSQKT